MLSSLLHPGRMVWTALGIALGLAALFLIAIPELPFERDDSGHLLRLATGVFGAMAVVVVAAVLVWVGVIGRSPSSASVDQAFLLAALCWLLLLGTGAGWAGDGPAARLAAHAIYQLAVASVVFLLLVCVSSVSVGSAVLSGLQAVLALGLLGWYFLGGPELAYLAWKVLNVVCATTVFLMLGAALRQGPYVQSWLVSGAGLVGLGILLRDMALADSLRVPITTIHHVYAAYLAVLWLLVTGRIGDLDSRLSTAHQRSENSVLANDFAHTDLIIDEPETEPSNTELTVNLERRRIAQDLHDGVGSQLVSILSSLDRGIPQQRSLSFALEQCLLDVKILVDAIDESSESVTDALGRLRYRVQHSLDRLGIQMVWDVDVDGPLQTLQDDRSRQVLRIAQESIANVMRHSKARTVWLSCHCQADQQTLVLEVRDDGIGFEPCGGGRGRGKGLEGMRRRAEACGGRLDIESAPGQGTRVRVTMALGERRPAGPNGTPDSRYARPRKA